MTDATGLFTAKPQPNLFATQAPSVSAPLGSTGGSGAISGGLLRPGSIDQTTFLQLLQQQQQNRQAAGVGGKPVSMPSQSFQSSNIPTLSPAQFAALVGGENANPGLAAAPVEAPAGDPQAVAAAQTQLQTQARAAVPMVPSLKLSGTANRNALPATSSQTADAAGKTDTDAPTITRGANAQLAAAPAADSMPTITRKGAATLEASAAESAEEKPADSKSETASKGDPNVIHLKSPPDKDQIKEFRMRNKRWVVDETPGARQLFFGADGEFGWDDFLDVINPLQHIPIIAQVYRAVTGDEINGAANLIGAIPFGPLGGVGLIGTVAELAVKDTTGDDIGGNLQAMLFGRDEKPEPGVAAPADMAEAVESGESAVVQTAALKVAGTDQTAPRVSDASEMHAACRG
jgi:hypothetical protein